MKKLITIVSFFFALSTAQAVTTVTTTDGDWSNDSIWSNGSPNLADTIIVVNYVTFNVSINLNNQFLIIPIGGTLCGRNYIFVGFNSTLQVEGYLGASSVQVEGTFVNSGTTYSYVTIDAKNKDAEIFQITPINQEVVDCPPNDTTIKPTNPIVEKLLIKDDTVEVCRGERVDLDLSYSQARYFWSDGSENSRFSPTEEGRYYVTIRTLSDTLMDSVYVKIKTGGVIIPNIFTPNNDGVNDDFLPMDFDLTSLVLYNRWGREVLQASKADYLNYENLNDGTYFYLLEHDDKCLELNPVKGWVEISR